jgi:hypothetical protein
MGAPNAGIAKGGALAPAAAAAARCQWPDRGERCRRRIGVHSDGPARLTLKSESRRAITTAPLPLRPTSYP